MSASLPPNPLHLPRPDGAEELAVELARRDKIIQVLMDRVEQGMDQQGSDYSFFQTAVLLGDQVRERTRLLDEAMAALQRSNAALDQERRAADAARARLVEAIGCSSDGFALFDPQGRLMVANPQFRPPWNHEGSGPVAVIGESFPQFIARLEAVAGPAAWLAQWQENHERAATGTPAVAEIRIGDGQWLRISERPTAEGGVVGTYADISEIKRRENLRRERERARQAELLQATLDNLAQGVAVFDADDRLLVWNDRLVAMLDLGTGDLVQGMPRSTLPSVLAGDTPDETCLADGRTLYLRYVAMPQGGQMMTVSDITLRRRQENRIRELLDEMQVIFENAHVGIVHVRDRVFVNCNHRMAEIFGWPDASALIGKSTAVIYASHDDWEADGRIAYGELTDSGYSDRECCFVRQDGSPLWCHRSGRPLDQADPQAGSIWVFADVTQRRAQEAQLRLARTVFEHSSDALMVTDARGVIVEVNQAFTRVTGYTPEEIVGRTPSILKSGRHPPEFYAGMWAALLTAGQWNGEVIDRRKNGECYPKWLSISTVRGPSGEILNFIGSFQDISERKAAEEKIQFLAHHDTLTALPNRLLLRDRFSLAMEQSRRSGKNLAFMFLDLDEFKRINDSMGHRTGDALLVDVVQRLRECLRETDTISRQGGDEFIVLLSDVDHPVAAASAAGKIIHAMAHPFDIDGHQINTSVSIGIALAPADGTDFDTLLQKADMAMYHSKERGRGGFSFFRQSMNDDAVRRHTLVNDLHRALETGEFQLHYQPQVAVADNTILGCEALLRWHRPGGAEIGPGDFVSVAEETGLILPLGEWAMGEACRQARLWLDAGIPARIAVNVSGVQIYRSDVPALLACCTREAGIPPALIEIELTESTLMHDSETVREVIRELKGLGSTIAIDDFGTGYSSLSYLSRFNVDKLKIDRSFIIGSPANEEDNAIVRMITQMAHVLRLRAVAEGVETPAQLAFLRHSGCDVAQGYLISRPLEPAAYHRFARIPHSTSLLDWHL